MKRIAWVTDIHLEFLKPPEVNNFCQSIADSDPDIVLIGGDIGTAPTIKRHLSHLAEQWQLPIYFVLGNHDFYGGSMTLVRSTIIHLTKHSPWLHWLPTSGVVELSPNTGLIGHDSWADGRLGHSVHSQVLLNDYFYIAEFIDLAPAERFAKLNALGDEAAAYFKDHLPAALQRFRQLLLLTHVPPFKEACWHEGQISDNEFLPHFACKAVGDVLVELMQKHAACQLTVLCGHTHGQGEADILPNLHVKTGGAVYGSPHLQEMIVID